MTQKKINIKNMVCNSCIKLLKLEFSNNNIEVIDVHLGSAEISFDENKISSDTIEKILQENGFELIRNKEEIIVEQIKQAVIELVHYMNNVDSIIRKSEYLVEKMRMNYQQISKLFSKHELITLEKYIIFQKIERIKTLIENEEFTISEIAYMMDYSSVQHLSTQFKTNTGYTVSEFKNAEKSLRKSIDKSIVK